MPVARLREYDRIGVSPDGGIHHVTGGVRIPPDDFQALKTVYLEREDGEDVSAFLPCLWSRSEALQARSYVGVVVTPSGLVVEILPKTVSGNDEAAREREQRVLVTMLGVLPQFSFRLFRQGLLATGDMPLLEVFLHCFVQEVTLLVRRGVASDYVSVEENSRFLRGRLLVAQHLRHNAAHRERFYVRHDEFLPNRPENRLIKAALLLALRLSRNAHNRRLCKLNLRAFEAVPPSTQVDADRTRCRRDRNLRHYDTALVWCGILLDGKTPVPAAGRLKCFSVLFSMHSLFEKYVATVLRKRLDPEGWKLRENPRDHSLVEGHNGQPLYTLKPDLILRREQAFVVADTKWKRIKKAGDISRDDLLQLFAYSEKYLGAGGRGARGPCFLIYPKTEDFQRPLPPFHFGENRALLHAVPFDLEMGECALMERLAGL